MTKYFSEKMNNHCYRATNAFTHYIPYSLVYVTEKSRSQFYLSIPAKKPAKNLQRSSRLYLCRHHCGWRRIHRVIILFQGGSGHRLSPHGEHECGLPALRRSDRQPFERSVHRLICRTDWTRSLPRLLMRQVHDIRLVHYLADLKVSRRDALFLPVLYFLFFFFFGSALFPRFSAKYWYTGGRACAATAVTPRGAYAMAGRSQSPRQH